MDIEEFERVMESSPCCNHKTVLGAIKSMDPSDEELLEHMAYIMTDEDFKDDRIFFLPLVSRVYKKIKDAK